MILFGGSITIQSFLWVLSIWGCLFVGMVYLCLNFCASCICWGCSREKQYWVDGFLCEECVKVRVFNTSFFMRDGATVFTFSSFIWFLL